MCTPAEGLDDVSLINFPVQALLLNSVIGHFGHSVYIPLICRNLPQFTIMPLKVVVVGAGIAGLATAIGFARHGHHVAVYERRETRTEESGSGILLQPNAMRVLEAWGLRENVEEIGHHSGVTKTRRYDTGKVVGIVPNGGKRQ